MSTQAPYLAVLGLHGSAGRVLVGVDTSDFTFSIVEKTGGSQIHQLTVSEMPSHNHSYAVGVSGGNSYTDYEHLATYSGLTTGWSSNVGGTGGNAAHNNLKKNGLKRY